MFCCAYGAQPQAAPAPEAKLTGAALSPKDPGYIEEDPVLAKLVGKPAPALTLKSIDGKSINLSDLYGKRPVYLKLWATYCIPCRVQMPGLKKIFASYGDQMTIIAVNAAVGDDIGKVKQFAQDFDLHMPVTIDDGRLVEWVGMKATPVHLVIGRDGRVIFAGHQDGPELDAAIKQALASKASPGPQMRRQAQQVDPAEFDCAAGRNGAHDRAEQGGFSRTVAADKSAHFTFFERKRCAADDRDRPDRHVEIGHPKHGQRRLQRPSPWDR